MANPDRYITIADFRPGIWGDTHAGQTPDFTGSPDLQGAVPENGRARVDGTSRCRADKTGALIPLPRRADGTAYHAMTVSGSTDRPGLFLLDAEIGAPLAPINSFGLTPAMKAADRSPVFVAYSWFQDVGSSFFLPYTIGTEIRGWANASSANSQPYWDFMLMRPASGSVAEGATGLDLTPLPSASFAKSRYYYGDTIWGQRVRPDDFTFNLEWWYPCVAVAAGVGDAVYGAAVKQGTLSATELGFISPNSYTSTYTSSYVDLTTAGDNSLDIAYDEDYSTYAIPDLPHDESMFDFWLFCDIAASDWTPTADQIIVSETSATPNFGWRLVLTTDGYIKFEYSTDGTTWDDTLSINPATSNPVLRYNSESALDRRRFAIGIVQRYTDGDEIEDGYYAAWYQGLDQDNVDQYMQLKLELSADGTNIALDARDSDFKVGADDTGTNNFKGRVFACALSRDLPNTPHLREGFYQRLGMVGTASLGRPYYDTGFGLDSIATDGSTTSEFWSLGIREFTVTGTVSISSIAGTASNADILSYFTPAIGPITLTATFTVGLNESYGEVTAGTGTCIGMNVNNGWFGDLPIPRGNKYEWAWHYNDEQLPRRQSSQLERRRIPNSPYMTISHQGRVVFADRRISHTVTDAGSSTDVTLSALEDEMAAVDDILWYSNYAQPLQDMLPVATKLSDIDLGPDRLWPRVNGGKYPTVTQTSYTPLSVIEDIVADIGAIGSVTTDQLLVVKSNGGGALVSGDLDQPTIRRLPYIESTNGVIVKPIGTPLGLVYASSNGIYAWQGGETSTKLSPQIDGDFFKHTTEDVYSGASGRLGFWNGLLLVPNNYVYDTETQSWWRLEAPTDRPYNVYNVTNRGEMYAFPYKRSPGTASDPVWYVYNNDELDVEYTWQSHPLLETRGRTQIFQELRLVATGHDDAAATIEVTLSGFDREGDAVTPVVTTFTLAAKNEPQYLYKDFANFQAEYVTVSIEAASNSSTTAAPKIHSISLGVKDGALTPRHG